MQVESGTTYRHFKGDYYVVVGEATHTETSERMVVYHRLQSPELMYVRPKSMFFEKVPHHNYPGNQKTRFVPVTREEVLRDAGK